MNRPSKTTQQILCTLLISLATTQPHLRAHEHHFAPLPIDFYSKMVGHFEALCELSDQGKIPSKEMEKHRLKEIRKHKGISHKNFINTIKAYLTAQQSYPDCFKDTPTKSQRSKHHQLNKNENP